MGGLKYQLKSVLRDKFCLMTFLLPILVAAALNFMGSIDMSSLGELHFGVLENGLPPQTVTWLERYGPVTAYGTQEELTAAIMEPSTNVIGVRADGDGLKTAIAGDELDIFQQAAATLPALYERRAEAERAEVLTLERPDILESFQDIFIPAVLIVAMFMGCTFNAMNIISEKEDGVALVNEILPMTPGQYILQKVVVGFFFGSLSSIVTACICFRLSWQNADCPVVLRGGADRPVHRQVLRGADDRRGLYQNRHAGVYRGAHCMRPDWGQRAAGAPLQSRPVPARL